ncbi:MAG TPA: flagellar protein FlhE [Enterobacteriaceae bacterium]|nr:flagellar protein FlhE [Enterobacteriaceae bacterium]
MHRWLAGIIALMPLLVNAAGEGAWMASSVGVIMQNRGVAASSSPLSPPQPVNGLVTVVQWEYKLVGPTPANLLVRLCSQSQCVELDAESGSTRAFSGIPAIEPMRFVWDVPGSGRLYPALQVLSNRVIVNYK